MWTSFSWASLLKYTLCLALGFGGGFALCYYQYPQVQVVNSEDSIIMMEEKTFTSIQDDIQSIKDNFDELIKVLSEKPEKPSSPKNIGPKVKIN